MRDNAFAEMSAFVAIAERRSFAKAARHLGIAPSTLSQTIRALETRLGVRLLNRTTRSVAPTAAGERLLTRLRPLLEGYEEAVESINAFRDRPAGLLRLTAPPLAASFVLAPAISQFLAEYPDIKLEISLDSAMVDIVANRFDAGIRLGERVERDMIAVRVSNELQFAIVASPAYLARHPMPQRPQDFKAHNCIQLRVASGAILPWRFEQAGESLEITIDGNLTVNSSDLGIRAALDGVGALYTTRDWVAPLIAEGRLVTMLDDWAPRSAGYFLFYPSRRQNPATLQVLIDFLRNRLKANGANGGDRRVAAAPTPKLERREA
ncbi:MAG TPA: LysR family transcriptional regulator [Stellaceae bacterium]|nr:LysR family transcriptional regulator [Stellaceae bacterium]